MPAGSRPPGGRGAWAGGCQRRMACTGAWWPPLRWGLSCSHQEQSLEPSLGGSWSWGGSLRFFWFFSVFLPDFLRVVATSPLWLMPRMDFGQDQQSCSSAGTSPGPALQDCWWERSTDPISQVLYLDNEKYLLGIQSKANKHQPKTLTGCISGPGLAHELCRHLLCSPLEYLVLSQALKLGLPGLGTSPASAAPWGGTVNRN